jgi:hypothetical protein
MSRQQLGFCRPHTERLEEAAPGEAATAAATSGA